jgi:hypothetical protein
MTWFIILPRNEAEICHFGNCLASCHFEAISREIPLAQQVKASWLDKIYGQSSSFTNYLWGKSKAWGISPFGRNDTILLVNVMLGRESQGRQAGATGLR